MSTQVTLTLPDNIYRQVESVAQATNRPVAEVLAETIRQAFPPLHVDKHRAEARPEDHDIDPEFARQVADFIEEYRPALEAVA